MFGELHLLFWMVGTSFPSSVKIFRQQFQSVCPQSKTKKNKNRFETNFFDEKSERKKGGKKENKKQLSKFMWVWRNKEEKRKLVFVLCDLCLFFRSCKVCDRCKTKSYVFPRKSFKLKSKFWLSQGKTFSHFQKWSILNGSVYFIVKTALRADTKRKRRSAEKTMFDFAPTERLLKNQKPLIT